MIYGSTGTCHFLQEKGIACRRCVPFEAVGDMIEEDPDYYQHYR